MSNFITRAIQEQSKMINIYADKDSSSILENNLDALIATVKKISKDKEELFSSASDTKGFVSNKHMSTTSDRLEDYIIRCDRNISMYRKIINHTYDDTVRKLTTIWNRDIKNIEKMKPYFDSLSTGLYDPLFDVIGPIRKYKNLETTRVISFGSVMESDFKTIISDVVMNKGKDYDDKIKKVNDLLNKKLTYEKCEDRMGRVRGKMVDREYSGVNDYIKDLEAYHNGGVCTKECGLKATLELYDTYLDMKTILSNLSKEKYYIFKELDKATDYFSNLNMDLGTQPELRSNDAINKFIIAKYEDLFRVLNAQVLTSTVKINNIAKRYNETISLCKDIAYYKKEERKEGGRYE